MPRLQGGTTSDDTTITILLKRIEALEKRVPPEATPGRKAKKPVNTPAYNKAINAMVHGNRRPLEQYLAIYRVPGTQF